MPRSRLVWRSGLILVLVVGGLSLVGCGGRRAALSQTPPASTTASFPGATTGSSRPAGAPATLAVTPAPATRSTSTAIAISSPTVTPTTTPTATPTSTPTPSPLELTHNILVLGVDHRTGDEDPSWRTDTIMVVALDYKAGRVGVVSVPRDLYVEVPGFDETRINRADFLGERSGYPGGGAALVRRVLTETLGIPTQNYVRIQMDGLVQLVDALGGVTVTLDCPLYERTPDANSPNGVADWVLPAGEQFLDGETAKKFATYRYVTSDFGRAGRQQQLIWAVRDRALQLDVIPYIPELWQALAGTFVTDLNLVDVVRLATLGVRLDGDQVHGVVIGQNVLAPAVSELGEWVLVIDDQAALIQLLGGIFAGQPLASLGHTGGAACPATPTPVPTFTPTPDGTATIIVPTASPTPD